MRERERDLRGPIIFRVCVCVSSLTQCQTPPLPRVSHPDLFHASTDRPCQPLQTPDQQSWPSEFPGLGGERRGRKEKREGGKRGRRGRGERGGRRGG